MYPDHIPLDQKNHWTISNIFKDHPANFVGGTLDYNCSAKMHTHDFHEINFILHGKGCYYVGDTHCEAQVGDVFITPPGIYHGYLKDEAFHVYNLYLRKEFFDYYKRDLAVLPGVANLLETAPYLYHLENVGLSLHLPALRLAAFKQDLDLIVECNWSAIVGVENVKNAAALKIIAHLGLLFSNQIKKWSVDHEKNNFAAVMESLDYVRMHLEEKLTIDLLAEKAHMSRSSFERHFKKLYHCTPMEYIRNARVVRARELIAKGTMTKAAIAQDCGFYDASHMEKCLQNK